MPVVVVRAAPPTLDRSLVPYTVNMINRICDALLKAFGGDFQTGITTTPAIGAANIGYNVVFPAAFQQASGPCVLVSPTSGGTEQWKTSVGISTPTFFSIWGTTVGGGPSSVDFTARWVAWYP